MLIYLILFRILNLKTLRNLYKKYTLLKIYLKFNVFYLKY